MKRLLIIFIFIVLSVSVCFADSLVPPNLTLETMIQGSGCTKDPNPVLVSWVLRGVTAGTDAGCTKDTETLVYNVIDAEAGAAKAVNVAYGQLFSYGSGWSLHSIDIWHNSSSTCTEDIRIGTTQNLATYDEEWANEVFPDEEGWHTITSISNPSYASGEDVYFAGMEKSGACKWDYDADNPNPTGTYRYANSTDWDLDTTIAARDFALKVYK